MHPWPVKKALNTEAELLAACHSLEGLSFLQLAAALQLTIPAEKERRKGWAGLVDSMKDNWL